ncbi:hypothetical protein [Streptomyces sp. NPDC006640]|uniref:hypothetical protein n=1 Tax=unclassified Streptomyces TaxID=2593676 RepID=UPI00367A9013
MKFDIDALGGNLQLEDEGAELRPVFDPRLRYFTVQLWKGGEPAGIHGRHGSFRYPDEPLMAVDTYLAEKGIRALTDEEKAWLYAGLVCAKGGPDWQMLLLDITQGL